MDLDADPDAVAFRSAGCGTWSSAFAPVAVPGQPFGDGWFIVGVDIAPGRYRTAAAAECVWERLSGFLGWRLVPGPRGYFEGRPYYRELPRWPDNNGVLLGSTASGGAAPVGTSESRGQPERAAERPPLPGWSRPDARHESFLAIVDIAPTDAGFRSEGCGLWTNDLSPTVSPGQSFGDGTFLVGPEIAPGRYRAIAPTGQCQWQRWKRFGGWPYSNYRYGGFGETVPGAGGRAVARSATAIADIAPSDAGFHSEGCGVWTNDPSPAAGQPTAPGWPDRFGEGTHRVGADIPPGRYRSLSPDGCEWARLSGFGGSGDDVIASSGVAVVDIAPPDAGFHSAGCGTWTSDLSPAVSPGQPFGAGALFVGREIAPGRYYAHPDAAAPESRQCRWQRLRRGDRGLERAGAGSGWRTRVAVDVAHSDEAFHSENCGVWNADPAPSIAPGQPFGDPGLAVTWLVGIEIAPGKYRAYPDGDSFAEWPTTCTWRRLGGFGGADGDTIESGGVRRSFWTGQYFLREQDGPDSGYDPGEEISVGIAPTDAGFFTHGCGTWTPAP